MCSGATDKIKDRFSASNLSKRRQVWYESQQDLASVHSLEDWSLAGNFLCNRQVTKSHPNLSYCHNYCPAASCSWVTTNCSLKLTLPSYSCPYAVRQVKVRGTGCQMMFLWLQKRYFLEFLSLKVNHSGATSFMCKHPISENCCTNSHPGHHSLQDIMLQ